ncbi:hypothetical protein MGYG_09138 [Nannizzia gypsea CBS 118893]|uniref:Uncharacterized protein n=1 Tax=Arthroderma gypseum (strain ATCC MYA-4604 / CBS 118893) TaxID=535722 RepID=E4V166_ARTGP|nr:hypothetical protein MGYG_09138 [Nannizzia gypsea CBS 118893]EFR03781.1 hypothetical protein MGYG_09138 [Nannizzia gypsea CBS 118893]
MCDYVEVNYECSHIRLLVRAWCVVYQKTQKRCPPNIVASESRPGDKCATRLYGQYPILYVFN